MPRRRIGRGDHVPAPRAEHVAADDGGELDRPHQAGRQPGAGRREEGGPEEVPALLERVGDRDDDPLAVDEQVRQVVGDEVAERDRQQAGADRAEPDRPRDRERQQRRRSRGRRASSTVRTATPGAPNRSKKASRLRQAVEDDRADAEAPPASRPRRSSRARAARCRTSAVGPGRPRPRAGSRPAGRAAGTRP